MRRKLTRVHSNLEVFQIIEGERLEMEIESGFSLLRMLSRKNAPFDTFEYTI